MNGPLIAGLMVLAAVAFLGWFSWIGICKPSEFASNLALWTVATTFAPAFAWAWGLRSADVLWTTIAVAGIVAGAILKGELIRPQGRWAINAFALRI